MEFSILDSFDPVANFWEVNKQLKVMSPFAKLYNEDKSTGKATSSRIMWGIALVYDPKSKYSSFPEADRKALIAKDWMMDRSFKWQAYKELSEVYQSCYVSQAKRSKKAFEEKLNERDIFINSTPYTMDNAKLLDDILTNTDKLYKILTYLDAKLEGETAATVTHGDQQESVTEEQKL